MLKLSDVMATHAYSDFIVGQALHGKATFLRGEWEIAYIDRYKARQSLSD